MSVTINLQPTYPNVTRTNLLYVVGSNEITASQYQYVMDVVSGSLLTRIKQYPNPAGVAVYDVGKILGDYIDERTDIFDISGSTNYGSGKGTFTINFGEEYGTSPSSSVTLYNGSGTPGSPAVTGTTSVVWEGIIEPNNGSGYNWDDVYSNNIYLTSYPNSQTPSTDFNYKKVAREDYGILSFKGDDVSGTIQVTLKTKAGGTIGSPINVKAVVDSVGTIIPVGPQNLLLAGVTQSELDATEYYYVTIGSNSFYFYIDEGSCHYERVNFFFLNKQGAWDFHGITLPKRKSTEVTRQTITKPFVDYSSLTSTYDNKRRGSEYYHISLQDRFTISTQYLTQGEADWLSEMLESSNCFIQEGDKFSPIMITNSSYTHNTNKRTQKIFQYDIEYTFSNQRRVR